jgi:hypothetical protein
MKSEVSKETAETRVTRKYAKLYVPLIELVDTLQNLEPGGILVDEAEFTKKDDGGLRVAYKARPMQLTIIEGHRRFSLKVEELE